MNAEQGVTVQELKARVNIVEVVRRYVNLQHNGGRWVAPCPFHQETKPSFSVNEEEGFYYCFGCQAHGDVIDFYCNINGLEFKEGVEQLAAEMGLTLAHSSRSSSGAGKKEKEFSNLCLELYALAQNNFRRNLSSPEGRACLDYLRGRGVTPELAQTFGLGCSLPGWDNLAGFLRSKKQDIKAAVTSGLLIHNEKRDSVYDRFRNRLMFPIENLSSKVIAFGGRVISSDDEPKYINSSDSAIYKKGDHLYGLSQARRAIAHGKVALLTEGYMDVLTLHQFGYTNACGVLGTSLTTQQIKRLSGFSTRVDLLFDGDRAGRKAAMRSAQMLLIRGLGCRVCLMPEGEDVDSLLRGPGKEVFDRLLAGARDGLDYCLQTVRESGSAREIVEWAKAFTKDLQDPGLLSYFLPKLSKGLELDEAELRNTVLPASATAGGGAPAAERERFGRPGRVARPMRPERPDVRQKQERDLLRFGIRCPQHVPRLRAEGAARLLVTPWCKALWMAMNENQGGELLPFLGEEEKRFYIQCRLRTDSQEQEEQRELEEICSFLARLRKQEEQGSVVAALRRQSTQQTNHDELELLRALQETLGRNNGEH